MNKTQKEIVRLLKEESNGKYTSAVWFDPFDAAFLFFDQWCKYEDIHPLIINNVLVFSGFESHQGITMAKYILN